jgi:hypothetical protein
MNKNLALNGDSSDKHLIAKAIEYITGYAVDTNTIQHEANNVAFKYRNKDVWSTLSTKLIDDTIRMHEKSLRGRFEEGGEAGFDDSDTTLLLYHEKKGNFMIPKNQIYLWLYEGKGINEKLESEEYDYVFYPPVTQNMAWRSNFVPPLKQIWTKKFQKINKGSDKLLGVIKAYLLNDGTELYIDMMSTNPAKKKSGIMSYMIQDLRNTFNLTQDQVTFSELTPEGEKFVAKKTYADGGDTEEVYIEFLNKEKGFKKDIKNFNSYEEAVKWARENFEKFNSDMIKYTYADGGSVWEKNGFTQYPRTSPKEWELVEWSLDGHSPYFKGRMYFQANTGLMFIAKENDEIYTPKSSNKLFWRKQKKYDDGGDVKSKNNKIEWVKNVGEEGWSATMELKNAYENIGGYVSTSGNWKIYRSGRWYYDKYIGGDNFKRDGDWGVYRNDKLYGEFDSLKEAKQYVENWVRINPKDYADGGDIPHEDKMFQLPLEMVIYVPSTQDVDKVISVDKMDKRVDEVKEYLASKFGGYTSSDKLGGYVDSNVNLVNEDVVQITSFSTKEAFEENKKELIQQIAKWGKDWGQEAIGFEFEGDLMYVPQEL